MYLEPRECPACKFIRIPESKTVRKKGKHYRLFKCRLCQHNDIEIYVPHMLWDGKAFVEEKPDEYDTD